MAKLLFIPKGQNFFTFCFTNSGTVDNVIVSWKDNEILEETIFLDSAKCLYM